MLLLLRAELEAFPLPPICLVLLFEHHPLLRLEEFLHAEQHARLGFVRQAGRCLFDRLNHLRKADLSGRGRRDLPLQRVRRLH
jgi:hypothetical protein